MAVDCTLKVSGEFEDPVASLSNDYLRIDLNGCGQFVIGTTQGNPDIEVDDGKRLIYGYGPNGQSSIWSSYTTILFTDWDFFDGPVGPGTYRPLNYHNPTSNRCSETRLRCTTVWTFVAFAEVTQTLSFMENPFSGRRDMVRISYNIRNLTEGGNIEDFGAGVRIMLDTMVGNNDDAPFLIPGFSTSSNEQEYLNDNIPDYFLAFESPIFASNSLKSIGLLNQELLTTCNDGDVIAPCNNVDRVAVVSWENVFQNDPIYISEPKWWEYTINPNQVHGDSAFVAYWDVDRIPILNNRSFHMAYGLADTGGDTYWTTSPTRLNEETTEFQAISWINNTTNANFTNGVASINLPPGLEINIDEITTTINGINQDSTSRPIGDVLSGELQQVSWPIRITGGEGTYDYSTEVTFDGGQTFTTQNQLVVKESSEIYLPLIVK